MLYECDKVAVLDDVAVPNDTVVPYSRVDVASSSVLQLTVAAVCVVEEAIEDITGAVVSTGGVKRT